MAEKNKNIENSILGVENSAPKKEAKVKAEAPKKEAKVKAEAAEKKDEVTYIMKVTHLSWGPKKSRHFYAKDKPEISLKAMGKKHGKIIETWLKAGWIEKGKY